MRYVATAVMFILGASAASADALEEQIATIINLNGHLCASVTDVQPLELKDRYEVTCVEYRGGSGTVRYILDARKGVVFPA